MRNGFVSNFLLVKNSFFANFRSNFPMDVQTCHLIYERLKIFIFFIKFIVNFLNEIKEVKSEMKMFFKLLFILQIHICEVFILNLTENLIRVLN